MRKEIIPTGRWTNYTDFTVSVQKTIMTFRKGFSKFYDRVDVFIDDELKQLIVKKNPNGRFNLKNKCLSHPLIKSRIKLGLYTGRIVGDSIIVDVELN